STPSPISNQVTDATIGFVAENTAKRVSLVASPNVSKHNSSRSLATATWHAGVAPSATSLPAASRSWAMLIERGLYRALHLVQKPGEAGVRTICVTGAAGGIGAATCARLEKDGCRVIGVDLRDADIQVDLSSEAGRAAMVDGVTRACDGVLDG